MLGSWDFVETCSGSAAMTVALLGGRQQLIPYQGSKWKYRKQLQSVFMRLGFWGAPGRVTLQDVSRWDVVVSLLLNPSSKPELIAALTRLVAEGQVDPEGLWDRLVKTPIPSGIIAASAAQLWLQRMSYGGKAVGPIWRAGPGEAGYYWSVHGLSETSAHGCAARDDFGAVRPQGPGLLRTAINMPTFQYVQTLTAGAVIRDDNAKRRLVYMDPPYQDTSPYPSGSMSRTDVVGLALAWEATGATVIVSEDEPIEELARLGWVTEKLSDGKEGESPLKSKKQEWITFHRPPRALAA